MVNKLIVMEISRNNLNEFNKLVKQKGVWTIVKFYADWCGHCKILNPKWEEVTSILKKNNKIKGVLGSVSEEFINDVEVNSKIDGYPTIRVYHNGKYKFDYNGQREVSNLKNFIKKILGKKKRKRRRKRTKKKRKHRRRRSQNLTKKKKILVEVL